MLSTFGDDSLIRRVLGNGALLLAANGASAVLLAIKGLLVARAYGVAGFGAIGLIATFVTVVGRLTSFRMSEFVVQFLSRAESQSEERAVLKFSLCVEAAAALVAFLVVWLAAPVGARLLLRDPSTVPLIRLFAAALLVGLVTETATGVLQHAGQFRTCSIATTCGAATTLVGTIAAVVAEAGLAGVVLAMVAGAGATALVLSVSARTEIRARFGHTWWPGSLGALSGRWRAILRFIFSTNGSSTLSLITRDADLLWLGLFRGSVEAGWYRLAYSLAGLAFMPTAPLAQSIYPEIAREAAHRRWREMGAVLRRATVIAASYVIPVALLLAAVSTPLIALAYGPAFTPAVPALIVLLVGMGFSNVFFWSRPALLALQHPEFQLKVNFVLAVLKVGALLAVIPVYGYLGSAGVLTMAYLIGVGLSVWKARQLVARQADAGMRLAGLAQAR